MVIVFGIRETSQNVGNKMKGNVGGSTKLFVYQERKSKLYELEREKEELWEMWHSSNYEGRKGVLKLIKNIERKIKREQEWQDDLDVSPELLKKLYTDKKERMAEVKKREDYIKLKEQRRQMQREDNLKSWQKMRIK